MLPAWADLFATSNAIPEHIWYQTGTARPRYGAQVREYLNETFLDLSNDLLDLQI